MGSSLILVAQLWLLAPASTEPAPLLLSDVLASVRQNLPQVLAAREEMAASQGRLTSAAGAFDPVVRSRGTTTPLGQYPGHTLDLWVEQPTPVLGTSFFGGWRLGAGSFAPYDGKLATNDLGELRAGVRVPVGRNLFLDSRQAALQRSHLDVRVQEAAVSLALLESSAAAAQAYVAWVAAGRRVAVQQELLQLALVRDAALRQRAQHGDVPAMEVEENQRAVLARRSLAIGAQRSLQQAALTLGLYVRSPEGHTLELHPSRLPEELPMGPLAAPEASLRDALAKRPDLVRQTWLRRQASLDVRVAEQELLPNIDLLLHSSQDLGAGSVDRAKPEFGATVTMDLPLPARTARGKVESQSATVRKLQHQEQWLVDRIQAELRDALGAWETAKERLALARQESVVAHHLESQELKRFEHGEGTLLLVNLREQATADARLRVVDAQQEMARAWIAWMTATANLLTHP